MLRCTELGLVLGGQAHIGDAGGGGSGAPPAAATSPGPDYSAYHQYYQQYAA